MNRTSKTKIQQSFPSLDVKREKKQRVENNDSFPAHGEGLINWGEKKWNGKVKVSSQDEPLFPGSEMWCFPRGPSGSTELIGCAVTSCCKQPHAEVQSPTQVRRASGQMHEAVRTGVSEESSRRCRVCDWHVQSPQRTPGMMLLLLLPPLLLLDRMALTLTAAQLLVVHLFKINVRVIKHNLAVNLIYCIGK